MRRLVYIILLISLIMLAGCGSFAKSNEPKGSISNITDKISKSETKSEEEQDKVETAGIDLKSFEDRICGTYTHVGSIADEIENWEIYAIDGHYYIEYLSDFTFGAAEIEILDQDKSAAGDTLSYKVKMYAYSDFSFAGEFWGIFDEFYMNLAEDGNLTLTAGGPFNTESDMILTKDPTAFVHKNCIKEAQNNTDMPEIIGSWRYEGEEDDNKVEHYIEFREDGTFVKVHRTEGFVPNVYLGWYDLYPAGNGFSVSLYSERLGSAEQPMDEGSAVEYNADNDTISVESMYGDDSSVYYRTKPGEHKVDILPGPCSRTDEVIQMWKEYTSIDDEF